jgi:hypothetical protein
VLAVGHTVDLYSYDEELAVPPGIVVRNAADVVPRDSIIFRQLHLNPALFSDLFRYAGLKRGLGTWIDADVILLRDVANLGDHVFGWQDEKVINGAILKLPPDSPFFAHIDKLVNARVPMPGYWGARKRLKQLARASVGLQYPIEKLEGGIVGPRALTHFALANGWAALAQPVDVFYPIHHKKASVVFDPHVDVESRFSARTRAVHLWNARIRAKKLLPPPPGSFIARMCERHGVDCMSASASSGQGDPLKLSA